MISEMLMNAGTWILAVAAIPQLFEVYENRDNLKGYSFIGSLALLIGLLLITLSFMIMSMWWSVLAQVIPLILWSMVTFYAGMKHDGN